MTELMLLGLGLMAFGLLVMLLSQILAELAAIRAALKPPQTNITWGGLIGNVVGGYIKPQEQGREHAP